MSRRAEGIDERNWVEGGNGLEVLGQSPEFRGPVEPPDGHDHGDDESNDHFASVYEDREEQFAAAIPFVEQGLERGERCLYVADDNSREDVLAAMRDRGIDVDAALESGALSVHSKADTYLRTGEFDRDAMVEFWEDALERATDDGYAGIRAAAEMTWALESDTDQDLLVEYEAILNDVFSGEDYVVLCQYNRERFPPEVVRDVIRTHPYLISGDVVSRNVYYKPPDEYFGPDDPTRDVDRMMGTLRERTEAKTELAERQRYLRRQNEITADADRAFEEKLQALFDLGCERFDLELGAMARVDPETDEFVIEYASDDHEYLEPGTELPLSETFCTAVTETRGPASVSNPHEDGYADVTVHREFGLRTYLGTYVEVDDGTDRTFFFASSEPRDEPFSDEERAFHRLLGQWVQYELDRKHHEAELQRSKEHFERIFENSHDAIFILDPHADEFVDVNPAASEMLGYTREELLRSLGPSDVHPDELDRFYAFVEEVSENGVGWTDELTCRPKDGEPIPAEISASSIDVDGRECALAVVRDVSDRKEREQAQQSLYEIAADPDRTFEEKLQALFELGCERFDLEYGGLAQIDQEADLFEVEAMSGEHDHLVPGRRYPLSETYCKLVTDGGRTAVVTDPVDRGLEGKLCYERFGVRTYLGTHLEVDDDADRTFFFLSNEPRDEEFSDAERTFHHLMGEWVRKELERDQREDQLQHKNDRLESFASMLAHELRNPVTIGQIYSQQLPDETDAETVEYVTEAFDRIENMVDVMLVLTRGREAVDRCTPVDLAAVAREAWDEVDVPDATLEVAVDRTIQADETYVRHLFRNLLENAVEHGSTSRQPGADDAVEHGSTSPRSQAHEDAVEHGSTSNRTQSDDAVEHGGPDVTVTVGDLPSGFYVADDGAGIPAEDRDAVFEAGYTTASDNGGTGLGLAFVKELADVYEWDVEVTESAAGGARFEFRNVGRDSSGT